MAPRPLASTTISFGLVSIPVRLYTATSAQGVRFNQLHDKCGGRLKQRLYCPVDDAYVERDEIVRGYEVSRNQYVRFTGEELNALEAERFQTLDLVEFVPANTVDFVYIEKSYYLGPDKGGDKAFHLLSRSMQRMERIAVGRHWWRGKVQLVLLRPYRKGLILHQVYHANEVRSYDEVELGEARGFGDTEEQLASMLIEQLAQERFEPTKYRDEYAERVRTAAEEKVAGQELTIAPVQPAAQIVDLLEALKQSIDDSKPLKATGTESASARRRATTKRTRLKGPKKAASS